MNHGSTAMTPDIDWLGWLAASLVLATFCMNDMVALRWAAIASNLAFIAYGGLAGLGPVLALHALLLPLNLLRLAQASALQRDHHPAPAPAPAASPARGRRRAMALAAHQRKAP
jgi:hypothetical protein